MFKFISHCHSHHSFDSNLKPSDIVKSLVESDINAVIINDHDVCLLTTEELRQFNIENILVLKAIEFTTREGVHVIGVHDRIELLQAEPYFYPIEKLIQTLIEAKAKIVLPHPYHGTGAFGNKNVSEELFETVVRNVDAFEVDNYRYGETPKLLIRRMLKINPRLVEFIGSDAHKASEVNAYVNTLDLGGNIDQKNVYEVLFSATPEHIYVKRRGRVYFQFKRFQKSMLYQFVINMLNAGTRRKIKEMFRL